MSKSKTFTLTETELQELLRQQRENCGQIFKVWEVFDGGADYQKILNARSPLLSTENAIVFTRKMKYYNISARRRCEIVISKHSELSNAIRELNNRKSILCKRRRVMTMKHVEIIPNGKNEEDYLKIYDRLIEKTAENKKYFTKKPIC